MEAQQFFIKGRKYFATDSGLQDALARIYDTPERPRCMCKPGGVEMYVAQFAQYVLKRMPDTGNQHHPTCPSYEPEWGHSGLADLMGEAVIEHSPESIEVRVAFPLSRVPGHAITGDRSKPSDEIKVPRRRMSLRALLHLLWHRARFDYWYPAMNGKRTWAVIRKYLLEAAGEIQTKGVRLRDLKSADLKESDSRIFPMWYTPVVVLEQGSYVIKPMRYHCRPQGKPEWYDKKYDGLYNARRDNLEGFWKGLFGKHHGVFLATSFFENVALHKFENRELRPGDKPSNVVLHFNPNHTEPMIVSCLWDQWTAPGKPDLLSFAAITDEPPMEVAATGHDRCIVPLRPENVPLWLKPEGKRPAELYALLDDRARPYYEHRIAA